MVAATRDDEERGDGESFVLYDVPWATYVALRDGLEDSHVRMTYLEGTLELVSPSDLHEEAKKLVARLLETWALEYDVDLRGFGSTTFRQEAKRRGLEAAESYKLGKLDAGDVPDLAIEVNVSRRRLDKLAVYAGLGVREVWDWRPRTSSIIVYALVGTIYEVRERSAILPRLDLALLLRFVRPGENHTQLVKAYLAALRAG